MLVREGFDSTARLRVSAIVPTLNEAEEVQRALHSLRLAGVDEIVVVDAGSSDATVGRATPLADVVLHESGGLFAQLNRGAAEASGDVLIFHYADVEFPVVGRSAVAAVLSRPTVVGGAFRLAFTSPTMVYRLIARGAHVRNRLRLGPFGDQSIFVRAEAFREMSGFRVASFLEDLQFVQRLRQRGRFEMLEACVRASVRRWERMGVLKTLLNHWWLSALYVVGKRRQRSAAAVRATELRRVR